MIGSCCWPHVSSWKKKKKEREEWAGFAVAEILLPIAPQLIEIALPTVSSSRPISLRWTLTCSRDVAPPSGLVFSFRSEACWCPGSAWWVYYPRQFAQGVFWSLFFQLVPVIRRLGLYTSPTPRSSQMQHYRLCPFHLLHIQDRASHKLPLLSAKMLPLRRLMTVCN